MMQASVIIDQVGTMLNDMEPGNQHVRWSVTELMGYITEATAAIAEKRPSIFMMYDDIELRPGIMQRVPDPFTKLIDIHFNINPDGSQGAMILPGVHELQQAFMKPGCSTDGIIHTFIILHGSNRTYEVYPPVPAGLLYNGQAYTPKVRAVLLLRPDVIESPLQLLNFPDTDPILYQGALVDWTLYRAYSKDQESSTSMERSKFHLTAFQAYATAATSKQMPTRKAA